MIHFVGAGSGAADLITVRGRKFLEEADVIIYAGSLVNPELLNYAKEACKIYDSAKMTLEEVLDVMRRGGRKTDRRRCVCIPEIRAFTVQSVSRWMYWMQKNISYDYCPGVSSFCGAASALNMEYTLPDVSQSVIITRMAGRTPVPEKEEIASFAAHQATMVVFLSTGMARRTIQASDCRRLFGKYAGSDCL